MIIRDLRTASLLNHFAPVALAFALVILANHWRMTEHWYEIVLGFAMILMPTLALHRLMVRTVRARCPSCKGAMDYVHKRMPIDGEARGKGTMDWGVGYHCPACGLEDLTRAANDSSHSL